MTVDNTPVTPDELHAFVDGELPADRQQAVNTWLATHPDDAALVAGWRAQADAIRTRYGEVANETVPDRLSLENVMRNGARSWRSIAAAAAVAAVAAFLDRRRRRLDGARRVGLRADRCRNLHAMTRSPRTGFISARCAIRSRSAQRKRISCPGCRAGIGTADPRAGTLAVRSEAARRTACCPACTARPRSSCMRARAANA